MDAAKQVVETLAPRELKAMGGQRDQFAPLPAKDLNTAERPPKSLLLQTIEAQRHEPFAPNRRLVDADGAKPEHSYTRFRVLGDDASIPAAEPIQRRTASKPYGPGENDRAAIGASRHGILTQ